MLTVIMEISVAWVSVALISGDSIKIQAGVIIKEDVKREMYSDTSMIENVSQCSYSK